jgi:hypothetical protein
MKKNVFFYQNDVAYSITQGCNDVAPGDVVGTNLIAQTLRENGIKVVKKRCMM